MTRTLPKNQPQAVNVIASIVHVQHACVTNMLYCNQPLFDNERKRCQDVNNKYCDPKVSLAGKFTSKTGITVLVSIFYSDIGCLIRKLMSVAAREAECVAIHEKDRVESRGTFIFTMA